MFGKKNNNLKPIYKKKPTVFTTVDIPEYYIKECEPHVSRAQPKLEEYCLDVDSKLLAMWGQ